MGEFMSELLTVLIPIIVSVIIFIMVMFAFKEVLRLGIQQGVRELANALVRPQPQTPEPRFAYQLRTIFQRHDDTVVILYLEDGTILKGTLASLPSKTVELRLTQPGGVSKCRAVFHENIASFEMDEPISSS